MRRKRCPVCGQRFPRSARYCDHDGVALVRAGGGPGRRRWALLLAAVAAVALALLAGRTLVERYLQLQVDVTVESVRFDGEEAPGEAGGEGEKGGLLGLLDDLGDFAGRLLGPQHLVVDLQVANRTPLPLQLRGARYELQVSGRPVGDGHWRPATGDGTRCAPGERMAAALVVTPSPEDALAIAGDLLAGEAPAVEVVGDLELAFLFTRFEVPFRVRRVGFGAAREPREGTEPAPPGDAAAPLGATTGGTEV